MALSVNAKAVNPCATDTMANYISTGCTEGSYTVSFGASAYGYSSSGGCPAVTAADVTVTPVITMHGAGFTFSAKWQATPANCGGVSGDQRADIIFTTTVTGPSTANIEEIVAETSRNR